MKNIVFSIIFYMLVLSIYSQSNRKLDSLAQEIQKETELSEKYVQIILQAADELRQIDPDSSLFSAQKAYKIIKKEGYGKLIASSLHRISTAYNFLGKYDTAVLICYKAIDEAEKLENKTVLMKALNSQAINFYYLDDLERADEYFNRCYDLAKKEDNQIEVANALQNIGLVKGILGDVTAEIENYQAARGVMEELEFTEGVANIDMNLGTAYISLGDYAKGLKAFQKAKKIFEDLGHKAALCVIYTNLAETNMIVGDLDLARNYALKSILLSDELSLANEKKYTLGILSEVYEQQGNNTQALATLKKYHSLKDSIFKNEKLKQIEELKVSYETRKKENDIKLLNSSNQLKDERLAQQRSILILLIGSALLFLILIMVLFNRYQLKKRSDDEKALLLKEIHHRVKNNLQIVESLLSLQKANQGDKKPEELLKISQDRIHAISTIHEKLYQSKSLRDIDFKSYVEDLIIHFASNTEKINFKTNVQKVDLDLDQLIPCGLIINELVTNSLKYAFEKSEDPAIEIYGKKVESNYCLEISDNGIGFSDARKVDSLGLKLVHSLVGQLDGSIKKIDGLGTRYKISFAI